MANTKVTSAVIEAGAILNTHIASGAISSGHLSSINTGAVAEGSNLYYTDARAQTRARASISVTGGNLAYDSSTGVLQLTDNEIRDAISAGGNLSYNNSTGVMSYTTPTMYTDADAQGAITVTDAGGDGSLAYSGGTITYTGPSAAEVRAHLSAGNALSYSAGQFAVVAPTASGGTNTTALATTAFVQQEITTLIGGAPSTLNDLNELANAINDDANYNSTLTTALATKLPLAGGTMTGNLTIDKEDPNINLSDTSSSRTLAMFVDNNNSVVRASGPLLLQVGSQSAITIDASRNTVLAGTLGSGAITTSSTLSSTINGNNASGGNIVLGALSGASKWFGITGRQYDNTTETEGYSLITGASSTGVNNVTIGGGLDEQNAATSVNIKVAANSTTRNGTEVVRVTTSGLDVRSNNIRITGTTVIDSSRNITSAAITSTGIITSAEFFKATGQNIKFSAGGTHVLNMDINRKIYPATHNSTDLGHSDTLAFRNLRLVGAMTGGATISSGAISATGSANSGSAAHVPAFLASGSYGGGIATRDTKESGWYQQTNGADWHFYHNRTVASDTPASKIVLSFNSSGNANFAGGITAGAAGVSTQDHRVPTGTGYITYSPANQTADVLNIRRHGTVQQKFDQYGVTFPSGNVGIGVTAPATALHIDGHFSFTKNGTTGNRYILIDGADATYAGTMNIQAGFGSTAAGGAIKLYAHSHATYPGSVWIGRSAGAAGDIMFGNGGTGPSSGSQIHMQLNSAGDLLIGNTTVEPSSNHSNQAGFGYDTSEAQLQIARTTNNAQMELSRNSANDGNWITFRKQGNVLGNIGTYGGTLYIGSVNGGLMFNGTDIEPTTGGTGRSNNTVSLGSDNYKIRDGKFANEVSATFIRAGEYSWGSSHAIFGQDRYRIRELNNLFYGATYRYGGYGSSSANLSAAMFNGNYDSGITLATNTTHVFEIDTGSTFTYPAGTHYISFYHVYNQFASIQIEQYHSAGTYSGQWRTCGTATDFRGTAGSGGRVIKIDGAGNNYTTKYRLTIVTNSNSCVLTDWSHYMTRSAGYDVNQFFKKDEESQLTRNIIFRNSAKTQVGSIVVGNSTAYNTTSDYRLKENVAPITSAAAKVQQLNPVKFNFIEDETNTLIDGFLAHEVASVVPEAVTGVKDAVTPDDLYLESDPLPEGVSIGDVKIAGGAVDPQQLDYTKLIPLLTAALQEALDRIEVLENQ